MRGVPRPPRPDPSKGVFETLLVVEGDPVEFKSHMARLGASIGVLYGAKLTEDTREAVEEKAAGIALGRLRVTLTPLGGEGEMAREIVTADVDPDMVFPGPERAIVAHSVLVEGGLGSHKWADRSLLAEVEAKLAEGEVPLLVDRDDIVLEASRANVFAIRGDALVTPPADGRILPGIARRRVMEAADASGLSPIEAELTIDDLVAADEVLLAGSVRGVEPVRSIDGAGLGRRTARGASVAAELRRGFMPSWARVI